MESLYNELINMKWRKNQSRPNVMQLEQKSYEGFVLGKVNIRGIAVTKRPHLKDIRQMISERTFTPKYKPVWDATVTVFKENVPDFDFTSVQYNKNQKCRKHKDGRNVGVSYIVGLGDYEGGELIVYDENGENPVKHDIKNKFFTFDGSKYPHETADFTGNRISLVFYSI